MMMTIDDIVATVDGADPWKVRAMCASAAERAAPLFRRLGRPESVPTFEAGLDASWAAVETGQVASVRGALEQLPEEEADDSHAREYYARLALLVLFRSLDYASTADVRKAKACLEEMASICDAIDTLLTAAPGQTFRYDPKKPPPPGEIQTKELRAQTDLLQLLRDAARPDAALIESLRQRAHEDSAMYDAAAPRLPLE